MDIPAEILTAFPPSADLLLDCARREIDDAMLMEIARADYGHRADEMFVELRGIRDNGIIPSPIEFWLGEVLSLTRWSNPDKPNDPRLEPRLTGRRGHQIRLFVCAALLRAVAEPANENADQSDECSLAQGLVSARVLGEEISEAAARFLTWRVPQMELCGNRPLFALGLLILAARLRSGRFADQTLGTLADWVIAEESLYRQRISLRSP